MNQIQCISSIILFVFIYVSPNTAETIFVIHTRAMRWCRELFPKQWYDRTVHCVARHSVISTPTTLVCFLWEMLLHLHTFWTLAHTIICEFRLTESLYLHHLAPMGLGVAILKICGPCLEMRQSYSPTFHWQELSDLATSKYNGGFKL